MSASLRSLAGATVKTHWHTSSTPGGECASSALARLQTGWLALGQSDANVTEGRSAHRPLDLHPGGGGGHRRLELHQQLPELGVAAAHGPVLQHSTMQCESLTSRVLSASFARALSTAAVIATINCCQSVELLSMQPPCTDRHCIGCRQSQRWEKHKRNRTQPAWRSFSATAASTQGGARPQQCWFPGQPSDESAFRAQRLAWRFFSATAASKARRRSASGSAAKVAFSSSSGRACSQVVSPVMFASRSSSCS